MKYYNIMLRLMCVYIYIYLCTINIIYKHIHGYKSLSITFLLLDILGIYIVTAVKEIKRTYGVTEESWKGDPCVPTDFSWSRLGCSSDKPPRIISVCVYLD